MKGLKKLTSGLLATTIIAGGLFSLSTNSFAYNVDSFDEFLEDLQDDNIQIQNKDMDEVEDLYQNIYELDEKLMNLDNDDEDRHEKEEKIIREIERLEKIVFDKGVAIDKDYDKGVDVKYLKNDGALHAYIEGLKGMEFEIPKENYNKIKALYEEINKLDKRADDADTEEEEMLLEEEIEKLEEEIYNLLDKNVNAYLKDYNIDSDDLDEEVLNKANKLFKKIIDMKDEAKKRKAYIELRYLVGIDNKDDYDENKKIKSLEDIIINDCEGSMKVFREMEDEDKNEIKMLYKYIKEDVKANRYDWVSEELKNLIDTYEYGAEDVDID